MNPDALIDAGIEAVNQVGLGRLLLGIFVGVYLGVMGLLWVTAHE